MAENITDLSGRVAVIIGATSGLGRAIAKGLARSGARVVPTGRRHNLVAEVCTEICESGGTALELTADVASRDSLNDLCQKVGDHFGRIDILVNAAGMTARKATIDVSDEDWNGILDANLTGMLRASQTFYEALKKSGRGRIINIASLSSFVAFHQVTAYGVSKAGVLALTKSLGSEWARDGINVNALVPGVFRTALNAELLDNSERGKELLMRTPMKRFGEAEELVGAAVFLASDAASFITGQSLAVDGGFLASGVNS